MLDILDDTSILVQALCEVSVEHLIVAGCLAIIHGGAQIGGHEPIQVAVHHILSLVTNNKRIAWH